MFKGTAPPGLRQMPNTPDDTPAAAVVLEYCLSDLVIADNNNNNNSITNTSSTTNNNNTSSTTTFATFRAIQTLHNLQLLPLADGSLKSLLVLSTPPSSSSASVRVTFPTADMYFVCEGGEPQEMVTGLQHKLCHPGIKPKLMARLKELADSGEWQVEC